MCAKGDIMPSVPIKDASNTTKIKQRSYDAKKASLDESTLNPRAKALLEELSTELGVSKDVIAELAITLYRLYKDKS